MDKWFSKTSVIRILAIGIAILLWAIVRLNNQSGTISSPDSIERVPIHIAYDETKYSINFEPALTDVELKGKPADLMKVKMSPYKVIADAMNLGVGKHTVRLTAVDFPEGVDLVFHPENVTVQLEKFKVKDFPVHINVTGKPAVGFDVGVPVLKPSRIKLTGSAEQLKQVDQIKVDIDIQDASATLEQTVDIQVLDADGHLLSFPSEQQTVSVTVPVTRNVKVVPLNVPIGKLPPSGYAISKLVIKPNQVSIYGAKDVLNQISMYKTNELNLEQFTSDQDLEVSIPVVDRVSEISPTTVNVSLHIVPSVAKRMKTVPIQLIGLAEGLKAEIKGNPDGVIDLDVEGAEEILGRISNNQVKLIANVEGLTAGEHMVPVQVQLPEWIRTTQSISDITITIK